jgi:hypothetical protein
VIKKEAEKILKYKDITIEIQSMSNVKIRATGTISKRFRKFLRNIHESMKSRSCREQPYWALRTYFGKY